VSPYSHINDDDDRRRKDDNLIFLAASEAADFTDESDRAVRGDDRGRMRMETGGRINRR
jgi:hypothetical protein